jgi:transposase
VQLVTQTGKPIAQVARELGINEGTLGTWCAKQRRAGGNGQAELSESERAELERLRKELVELRMQRGALKRSVALCVDEGMGRTQNDCRTRGVSQPWARHLLGGRLKLATASSSRPRTGEGDHTFMRQPLTCDFALTQALGREDGEALGGALVCSAGTDGATRFRAHC